MMNPTPDIERLMVAITRKDVATVGRLLRHIPPEARDDHGFTPLHRAALCGDIDVIKTVLDAGADIEAPSPNKLTALLLSTINGHVDAVDLLLRRGAQQENRLLHAAIFYCQKEMALHLLQKGAGVHGTDAERRQPLHLAATTGMTDIAGRLLLLGADINARDIYGSTPLIISIAHRKADTALFLIDRNADVKSENDAGNTALILAVHEGLAPVVRRLIESGADTDLESSARGRSALIRMAHRAAHLEIYHLLLDAPKIREAHLIAEAEKSRRALSVFHTGTETPVRILRPLRPKQRGPGN